MTQLSVNKKQQCPSNTMKKQSLKMNEWHCHNNNGFSQEKKKLMS